MEATAATVVGPAATHTAPPGPPVPATTAGAAQRVGASKSSQTQLGATGIGRGKGSGPKA